MLRWTGAVWQRGARKAKLGNQLAPVGVFCHGINLLAAPRRTKGRGRASLQELRLERSELCIAERTAVVQVRGVLQQEQDSLRNRWGAERAPRVVESQGPAAYALA